MNDDQGRQNFRMIQTWSVDALKDFLRLRAISTTGTKDMLVARTFFAYEQNLPILEDAKQQDVTRAHEYQELLKTEQGKLLDPLYDLTDSWLKDSDVYLNVPKVSIDNVVTYLNSKGVQTSATPFSKFKLNHYKDEKGYSYFHNNHIFDVMYHYISADTIFCFVKGKCTSSQGLMTHRKIYRFFSRN